METQISGGDRVPILLVEDEPDLALLIQDALEDPDQIHRVHRVECGEDAISYLTGEGKFADRAQYPFPVLVLLDLRMPGIGGFGVLRWLKAHMKVREKLDLIVLSSTQSKKEIEVVYELGAQFFWTKSDFSTLQEQVRLLKRSWLGAELA